MPLVESGQTSTVLMELGSGTLVQARNLKLIEPIDWAAVNPAPMFPEAEVLARIDDLDAKMNEMQGILARVPEGAFSEKVWSLDRRIYHPKYQEIDGAE